MLTDAPKSTSRLVLALRGLGRTATGKQFKYPTLAVLFWWTHLAALLVLAEHGWTVAMVGLLVVLVMWLVLAWQTAAQNWLL